MGRKLIGAPIVEPFGGPEFFVSEVLAVERVDGCWRIVGATETRFQTIRRTEVVVRVVVPDAAIERIRRMLAAVAQDFVR